MEAGLSWTSFIELDPSVATKIKDEIKGVVSIPPFFISTHKGEPAEFQRIKANWCKFRAYRHHILYQLVVMLKVEIFEISRFARVSAHITSLFSLKRGKTFSAISAHKSIKLSNFREFRHSTTWAYMHTNIWAYNHGYNHPLRVYRYYSPNFQVRGFLSHKLCVIRTVMAIGWYKNGTGAD